ncbi:MAG TPA: hypothetical protein PL033_19885 [Candidatus Brocadiia bacterium]|nr:hypothetical protein [Candidatus Brocadiia bacterium]
MLKRFMAAILICSVFVSFGGCATRAAAHRGDRHTERQVSRDVGSVDDKLEDLEKRVEKLEDEVKDLKRAKK